MGKDGISKEGQKGFETERQWLTPVILLLRRQRSGGWRFEARLGR
jgi:hypothetical protein